LPHLKAKQKGYNDLAMKLTASHASRPKIGEKVNGDAVVMRRHDACALFAVVDALGHGPTAAVVAERARSYLEEVSLELDIRKILTGLHAHLRGGRGAAAMICLLHDDRLEGCGVGNVELRISASNVPVVLSPGVLGGTVRNFRVFHGKLYLRSRIVLFSDGVSARFQLDTLRDLPPPDLCEHLVEQHGRSHDDATALVVDYEG
jgi:negative regulator of sigma-B (phosphoserine phosphatase)